MLIECVGGPRDGERLEIEEWVVQLRFPEPITESDLALFKSNEDDFTPIPLRQSVYLASGEMHDGAMVFKSTDIL